MSTKIAQKAATVKKDATKKLGSTPASAKAEKKTPSSGKIEDKLASAENDPETPSIDLDELEEQEDEAASSASSQSGNAAALAAATGSTEMSASFKNFRHHPDMENFYRFIYENDLRHEALAIIDEIMAEKQQRKLGKPTKGPSH